ncbi:MAG: hypothetical protein JOZ14_08120 [Acidobacteria bacterium]|nr:hypothetical protein [Acidobacteriota bacterium]
MQQAITFFTVVAGLVFSVAIAVMVEEFIFGQIFRRLFTAQPVRSRSAHIGGLK